MLQIAQEVLATCGFLPFLAFDFYIHFETIDPRERQLQHDTALQALRGLSFLVEEASTTFSAKARFFTLSKSAACLPELCSGVSKSRWLLYT